MLKDLHDSILENKTKEVLFKIFSQVLPVGTNVEKFGYATTCSFCQQIEDEIHLFVTCPRMIWLLNSVLCHYPTLINNLGVADSVLKLQRARIKTRVFSYFGKFKTF
jgi:hypothetical protein